MRGDFGDRRDRPRVALDRDDAARALRQQGARQPARPWSDLDDGCAVVDSGRARNARGQIEVEKKILTERFAGGKTVAADHVTQGRQVVDRAHRAAATDAVSVRAASRAASPIAAMRLAGSARPVPAMSNT